MQNLSLYGTTSQPGGNNHLVIFVKIKRYSDHSNTNLVRY